tara:strand:+ start:38 stop:1048 length:1011 start_codon:yes stop_codon:yes gene_type:complete
MNFIGKHGPLLIAEIGGNHEGNFEYAKKLCELAIDSDVDYIKFQIYTADKLVSKLESPIRNKHFKKFELTKENHIYLARMIKEAGLLYTSSVWDVESLEWLNPYVDIYKIGSGDLTAYPMLKSTAEKGKPIIISTGLSNEKEVLDSIKYIQNINPDYKSKDMLAILQCTSMYPIPFQDANLNVMKRLKELTDLTVGYSDHTIGSKAMYYATAIGAEILEFHFTDSRENKSFRDHMVSLTKEEVKDLVVEIKTIETLKGTSLKKPLKIEIDNGHHLSFRRSVYPSRNIKEGEVLTEDNLTVLRPKHGIDARDYDKLIGKKAVTDLIMHQKINWKNIE